MVLAGVLAVAILVPGLAASADPKVRYSGTIVSVGKDAIVLGVVGPWREKGDATVVTKRTIAVTPATVFTQVVRGADSSTGYAGDYVEESIDRGQLGPGRFATAECSRDGDRLTAVKISVVKIDSK
jgi:hypothetical protein